MAVRAGGEEPKGKNHTLLKPWRAEEEEKEEKEEEGLPLEPGTFPLPLPPLDIWSVNVSVFGARGDHFSWKEKEVPTAAAAGTQLSSNELENSFPLILIILEAS